MIDILSRRSFLVLSISAQARHLVLTWFTPVIKQIKNGLNAKMQSGFPFQCFKYLTMMGMVC